MDEHPFIELIEKHDAAVNRVCRSFCRDAEDREDLRQEILMHLWTGWKDYRPDHKPITWVYRVAVNTAISWRRHRLKQVDTCSFDGFDLPEDTVLREQATHLKSLIIMLPAIDQRLINLYLDGFSTDEIGPWRRRLLYNLFSFRPHGCSGISLQEHRRANQGHPAYDGH